MVWPHLISVKSGVLCVGHRCQYFLKVLGNSRVAKGEIIISGVPIVLEENPNRILGDTMPCKAWTLSVLCTLRFYLTCSLHSSTLSFFLVLEPVKLFLISEIFNKLFSLPGRMFSQLFSWLTLAYFLVLGLVLSLSLNFHCKECSSVLSPIVHLVFYSC